RDRGVSRDLLCRNRSLQFIADRGCDALTLMILMYVQPVQVSCAVYISESEEPFPEVLLFLFRFFRHDRKMLPKRFIPRFQIDFSCCPDVQLLRGIIRGVHRMDRFIKQTCDTFAVFRPVFSKYHMPL